MTSISVFNNVQSNTTYQIGSSDYFFVAEGATAASLAPLGLNLLGPFTSVWLEGTFLTQGVGLKVSLDDTNITIEGSGKLRTNGVAIDAKNDLHTSVFNAGTIFAESTPIKIDNSVGFHLVNSGKITSGLNSVQAIKVDGSTGSSLIIDNSGTIENRNHASAAISIVGGTFAQIYNTGKIIGSVFLGDGGDLFDSSKGTTTGTIYGGAGADTIKGGLTADKIYANDGQDLISGGKGADSFLFSSTFNTGSTSATADRITDFSHAQKDQINLKLIDADITAADKDAFHWIGKTAFGHHAGELHYSVSAGGNAYVSGDIDGNGTADFMIRLDHVSSLVKGDFVL